MTFDGWNMGWAWIWMIGGTILTVVVIVLVVWAVTNAMNRGRQAPGPPEVQETALDIVRKRYARGEISQAEFEQAVRTLKGSGQ